MIAGLLALAALLGAPLFAIFGGAALAAYRDAGLDASIIISELASLATMPLLRALPLFALAGYLLAAGRASERLLELTRAALGWLPGGLAVVSLLACTLLTAFTGASGVTIVALGGLLLPALRADGYGERFTLGLLTSGGNMGVLFAPSLPLILFAVIANPIAPQVTIDRLFLAALAPGLLGVAALGLYGLGAGLIRRAPRQPFSARRLGRALWAARWEAPLPLVVLGAIYSGRGAVSEAAVLTAAYALLVEVVIRREISLRQLGGIARDCAMLVGGVLLILGLGKAITNYLVDQDVPALAVEWAGRHFTRPVTFLIALNLFLLAVGCLMDIFTAIIVFVPLLIPLGLRFGVHPVHLGVIFLANLAIGYSTPPVGMNLFIAAIRFEQPLLKLARASLPFLAVSLLALLWITYAPALSLWPL